MKLAVPTTQYIFPPRAESCIPRTEASIFLEMGWIPQIKYNDTRTLIKILPNYEIQLWNRHGEKLRTYHCPEWITQQIQTLAEQLQLDPSKWHLLDGGLLDQKHRAIKDTIAIWDILVENGEHLLGTTYAHRYAHIHTRGSSLETFWYTHPTHEPIDLGIKISDNLILARQYKAEDYNKIWEMVETINAPYTFGKDIKPVLEGVVLKNPQGILEMGFKEKNNTSWMAKSRVTTGRHRF